MTVLANVAVATLTVFSLALAVLALRAWRHAGGLKVLLLAAGFALFAVKGLLLSVGLFASATWATDLIVPSVVLDVMALGAFYLAVLRRGGT